jgi:hypothetical protein
MSHIICWWCFLISLLHDLILISSRTLRLLFHLNIV